MAKQEEDIAVEISPWNNQNSHVANRDKDDNLKNQSSASGFQARVYRADVLRKSWIKQGLIVVFTGLIIMNIL
ncbi:Major facilitator superfamily domain general substrate transporter [Penicillium canescens]|nr:Major facilitator superfamily domain general substrate transporter [Penicillium canescens]